MSVLIMDIGTKLFQKIELLNLVSEDEESVMNVLSLVLQQGETDT